MSYSLWPHESKDARSPCPSPTPRVHSNLSIESVMPSNHLILCRPLLPSIFPSIGVFSDESVLHINFAQGEDLCLFAQSPSFGDPCEFDGIHAFWGWVCAQMWPTGVYHPVATVTGSEVGMLTKKANSGSMLGPFLWLAFHCFCYYNHTEWPAWENPAPLSDC